MKSWNEVLLKDVSALITKGTTPTSVGGKFTLSGINFIKSESLNYEGIIDEKAFAFIDEESHKKLKRSVLKESDILYSIAGIYLGKLGVVKSKHLPANTNQACAIIRLNHHIIDFKFVKHYLSEKSFVNYVNSLTGQAAQPNINLTDIGNLKLQIPPIATQKKIASVLSAYDDLIEVNSARIKILEETAKELYKEWFVRMRFPGYKKTKFNKGIPQGWEVKKIKDGFQITGGGTPSTILTEYWDGDVNWYTPSDITAGNGIFFDNSVKKITVKGLNSSSAKLFPAYSIMMTSRATIGAIGINTTPACTNQGFITCLPNKKLPYTYLYFLLLLNKDVFEIFATGSTFLEITKGVFNKINILVPESSIVDKYHSLAVPIFKQIENLQQQNTELAAIRDRLLPRLISGKLQVKVK